MGSCKDDTEPEPTEPKHHAFLAKNKITIADIAGIPAGVVFDKVRAEIQGVDWEAVDVVEASYTGGEMVLALPSPIAAEKLIKAVDKDETGKYTNYGFWRAGIDNDKAMVAGLGDIFAYNAGVLVGRIYLTDWTGEGTKHDCSFAGYHYADRSFSLYGSVGIYRYELSFAKGWNAYIDMNLTKNLTTRTTSIPEEMALVWRFESYVY
ncbi:hypothetical protein LJC45_05965 [Alistipes sp. OttesenSCG-928-B03]|nr:hypothetical protein [Alistipes sp. OttesenSCG-928-B03]